MFKKIIIAILTLSFLLIGTKLTPIAFEKNGKGFSQINISPDQKFSKNSIYCKGSEKSDGELEDKEFAYFNSYKINIPSLSYLEQSYIAFFTETFLEISTPPPCCFA